MKNKITKAVTLISNSRVSSLLKKYQDDKVDLYATQAAFYLIISAVPFLMFLLSLVIYVLPINQTEFLNLFNEALPSSLEFWVNSILSNIYSESTISVTSIAAITTLWAASTAVFALSKSLQQIYNSDRKLNTLKSRFLSMVYTLAFVVILVITMAIVIFSKPLINLINSLVPAALMPGINWLIEILNMSDFIPLILICFTFALMYKYLSFSKDSLKLHLPGAVFASVIWLLFSWIYAVYINNYSKVSVTYGSLANVVILMLWLKFCMNIFLLGAEINIFLKNHYEK